MSANPGYNFHRSCIAGAALGAAWFCFRAVETPQIGGPTSSMADTASVTRHSAEAPTFVSAKPLVSEQSGQWESSTSTESQVPETPKFPGGLENWAREHPDDAMTWALRTPNGPDRVIVVEILCLQLAQTDPAAAADLVRLLGANGYVLDNVIQQWAERDFPAANSYVFRGPASPDRDRLVSRLAFIRSKNHPAEAARWVAEQISPGEIQEDAAVAVFQQWIQRDRNAALAWLQTFPNGRLRERALTEAESTVP